MLFVICVVGTVTLVYGTDRLVPKVKRAGAKVVSVFKSGIKK